MQDADLSREIPIIPVRSNSENSGLTSTYSETSAPNESSVVSATTSGVLPPSPTRSYQQQVAQSPVSAQKSAVKSSPVPVPVRTPGPLGAQAQTDLQTPQLQTPQFGEPEVGDLLGDYSEQRTHYTPQASSTADPRILYQSDDEDTDPTSSITATGSEQVVNRTRRTATSTFGKVIQPLKERMNANNKKSSDSEEEEEASIPKGAIIFGYLQKQGRNGKWQTRWFESDGECLTYYKSSKRIKLLATLDLAKVGTIKLDRTDPKGSSFTINISQRPYHLRADSKESSKDWVITLNRIKEARLMQGNVKLVNSQPPDLLDSVAPRVVVVAGRQRTHAVDDDDIINWEGNSWNENPSFEDPSFVQNSNAAKWKKSARRLTKFASKVLRWARSIRTYGCTDARDQVVLDHHVHPPGHDDYLRKNSNRSKKTLTSGGQEKQISPPSIPTGGTNQSLSMSRSMSMEDARVLS